MRRPGLFLPMTLLASVIPAAPPATVGYPAIERTNLVERHFGLPVPDPYRWLDANGRTGAKVRNWVTRESELTAAYRARLQPPK